MSISDDVRKLKHSEFLYSRNGQYKTVESNFCKKQHVGKFRTTDLIEIDCNKVKLDHEWSL